MANFLSWFSLLACLLLILLGINSGFDISDEGFYVMLTVPSQENESGIINYDLFFKLLFQFTGYSFSLVELRLIRLVGYFLASLALTQFFRSQFKTSLSKPQVFLLSILGLFSGYAFLPPTLSYNSLTMVLGCFWIFTIFSNQSHYRKSLFLGLILAMLAYVKVTVALVLLLISIGFLVLKSKASLKVLGLLILPLLLLEVVFWIFLGDFALSRLETAISFTTSRRGYGLIQLLKSPLIGFVFTLIGLLIGRLIAMVKCKPYPISIFTWVLALAFFYWIIRFTHITEEWNHVIMLASSIFLGFLWTNSKRLYSISLEEIALFFLPFLLHIGSNVYWLRIGIHYWVFWLMLIFVNAPILTKTLLNLVAVLSILLVFYGIWWHPFGQQKPLWSEKTKWIRDGKEVILLDPAQISILQKIEKWEEGKGREQLLAAYRVPGLVWLTGRRIPFSPGIWEKEQLKIFFDTKPKAMI